MEDVLMAGMVHCSRPYQTQMLTGKQHATNSYNTTTKSTQHQQQHSTTVDAEYSVGAHVCMCTCMCGGCIKKCANFHCPELSNLNNRKTPCYMLTEKKIPIASKKVKQYACQS